MVGWTPVRCSDSCQRRAWAVVSREAALDRYGEAGELAWSVGSIELSGAGMRAGGGAEGGQCAAGGQVG